MVTLLGQDHPTTLEMRDTNMEILEKETDLEEYNPRDRRLKARLPALIPHWLQILLSDWFAQQW